MSDQDFYQLMREANTLPDSPRKVELLEGAVRLADSQQDKKLGIDARLQLIDAATFGGRIEKSIVAFSWVLAQYDEDPHCIDLHSLLWRYKWVVANTVSFASVARERILALEDDMQRRYLEHGFSLQVVHEKRFENARMMGELERAEEYYQKWRTAPRDQLSDCRACDLNHRVEALLLFGQPEEAFESATPLLNGQLSCRTMPEVTMAVLLEPALDLGKTETAASLHLQGYSKIKGQATFLRELAFHMNYLRSVQQWEQALAVFTQHIGMLRDHHNDRDRLHYFLAAELLFRHYPTDTMSLSTATGLPPSIANAKTDQRPQLLQWCAAEAEATAQRFDQRNGNAYWTKHITACREKAAENHRSDQEKNT